MTEHEILGKIGGIIIQAYIDGLITDLEQAEMLELLNHLALKGLVKE